jgi:transcriptional regulator with XRE-family HTH domain
MKGHLKARSTRRPARRPPRVRRPLLSLDAKRREERLVPTMGRAMRAARMRAGLTQADVAASIGLSTEVYGRLERGKMSPSVPTLFRVCVALRSGADELMGFAPPGRLPQSAQAEALSALGDTPDARRLLPLLGRLPARQLKLIVQLAMALETEPKRAKPQRKPRT